MWVFLSAILGWLTPYTISVGDPSAFDAHTALIVGPGFKEALLPGYPANEDAFILDSDYEGRELREIRFTRGKKVDQFDAVSLSQSSSACIHIWYCMALVVESTHIHDNTCQLFQNKTEP